MSIYRRIISVILLVVTLFITAVIWSFSFDTPKETTQKTKVVTEKIVEIVDSDRKNPEIRWMIVGNMRSIAHVVEFSALMFFAFLCAFSYFGRVNVKSVLFPFAYSVSVAVIDEIIQYFNVGRNSTPIDVLKDCGGIVIGFISALICVCIVFGIKKLVKRKAAV